MKYNLSDVFSLLENRQTIRPEAYSDRAVQKDQVFNILQSARWAPNHGGTEPWFFRVYINGKSHDFLDFVAETFKTLQGEKLNEATYLRFKKRAELAPCVIVVSGTFGKKPNISELEETEAVACAVQNILLAATAYGLGSFWQTGEVLYSPAMRTHLQLQDNEKALGMIYLGYPKEDREEAQRHRTPLEFKSLWHE
jgi:nitroreductase